MSEDRTVSPIVDEDSLRLLVADFYDRVRADPVLGPVFEGAVTDWPAHLDRLTAFWSSDLPATIPLAERAPQRQCCHP